MFTDNPITPTRLETLIDLLKANPSGLARETVYGLLQPQSLPGSSAGKFNQATVAVGAALELGLVKEAQLLTLANPKQKKATTRSQVLSALDAKVLASFEVEPYLALFYSYLLGLNQAGTKQQNSENWALDFNREVFGDVPQPNRFNGPKYDGIQRWLRYLGLGWFDGGNDFQCNPFERLRRQLPEIFNEKETLDDVQFMTQLARVCPELDGGSCFIRSNPKYNPSAKLCTLGLAHALVDLHLAEAIRIHCGADSRGWSLERASPPNDGKTLLANRIDKVELVSASGGN